jgi:hypothetical protein
VQISSIFDISTQIVSFLSLTHAQKQKLPRREKKEGKKGGKRRRKEEGKRKKKKKGKC